MKRFYEGKKVNLREAEVSDAEFILSLRTDDKLSRFISKVDNDLEKQKQYILNHQHIGEDCYFIVESKDGEKYGTARIYDVRGDNFQGGSMISKHNTPFYVVYCGYFAFFDYAFFELNKKCCEINVVKGNDSVINLHKRMGATLINEDFEKVYFIYPKETYIESRKKYSKYTLEREIRELACN